MRLNAYAIFDTAAGAYQRPFFLPADAQAIRCFKDIVADAEHPVGQHPEDYYLVRCGVWNDADCVFTPEAVSTLRTGLELLAEIRNVDPAQLEAFQGSLGGNGNAS